MTTICSIHPGLAGRASAVASVLSFIAAAPKVIARWNARRQALRQLYMIDGRTLNDIGISRSEINSVIFGGSDGRRRCHEQD